MTSLFERFRAVIENATEADIRRDPTLDGHLTLSRSGSVSVSYAPFDHVAHSARVAIVGITPGAQQASNALLSARAEIRAGHAHEDVLAKAKSFASFSGPMRANLIAMLDKIGLAQRIDVESCETLWSANNRLVHFTSALRYPVFVAGGNYSGQPSMLATPILRELLHTYLAAEAEALASAIWVPLGPKATDGLREMVRLNKLRSNNVLEGVPHPSGANAERIAYFLGRKDRSALSSKTNPQILDEARERLVEQVASWKAG